MKKYNQPFISIVLSVVLTMGFVYFVSHAAINYSKLQYINDKNFPDFSLVVGGINGANIASGLAVNSDNLAGNGLIVRNGSFIIGDPNSSKFYIDNSGNVTATGTLSVAGGKFSIGKDGAVTAAGGNFSVDAAGNVVTKGTVNGVIGSDGYAKGGLYGWCSQTSIASCSETTYPATCPFGGYVYGTAYYSCGCDNGFTSKNVVGSVQSLPRSATCVKN